MQAKSLKKRNRNSYSLIEERPNTLPSLSSHRQPAVWRGSPGRKHDES
ncbi:MAG: hypothetical protein MUE44_09770 [Oscillatoriaceae cyanobacterium Prado104]|nr:hypothetical protein [Oscillatoriaceae cyanobacterium Prado104]